MKNHQVCIFRAKKKEGISPEYAYYHLCIDVLFAAGLPPTKDVTVRIYTQDRQFIGTDYLQYDLPKTANTCHFLVSSSYPWRSEKYLIYVYRNHVPRWYAEVELREEKYGKCRNALTPLSVDSIEYFFADRVIHSSWWDTCQTMGFSRDYVNQLFQRFSSYRTLGNDGKWIRPSNFYIVGNLYDDRRFAKCVLSDFLFDGENPRWHATSLRKLAEFKMGWDALLQSCQVCRVIMLEISDMENRELAMQQFRRLCCLLDDELYPDVSFIFFGVPEMMDVAFGECREHPSMQLEDYTFLMPSAQHYSLPWDDRDRIVALEDDDFNPAINAVFKKEDEENEDDDDLELLEEVDEEVPEYPSSLALDNDLVSSRKIIDTSDVREGTTVPFEDEWENLQKMIGLEKVKREIDEARCMAQFHQERQRLGLEAEGEQRNHMLFLGNPGTGKTTVAKLVGRLYHQMGLLSVGHTVETCRSKLVGQFIGDTEHKMEEVIEEARGGVLFIDEAYTLWTGDDDTRDYGREVINALLPVLSEPHPDMIVIFAGYEDKMETVLRSNPGLCDRFPLKVHFENYSADELMLMAQQLFDNGRFVLSPAASVALRRVIDETLATADEYFGNGRWVHNLVEQGIIKAMAHRVMAMSFVSPSEEMLCRVEEVDILEAERNFLHTHLLHLSPRRMIGFTA